MKRIGVCIQRDRNKDGSITFALRWRKGGVGKLVYRKVLRTESEPSRSSLSHWGHEVAWIRTELERELNGEVRRYVQPVPLAEAGDLYLAWCRKQRSRSKAERMERLLAGFINYAVENFDVKNVGNLGTYHVARWRDRLDESGLSASTINCYLSDLSAWLKWCVQDGYAFRNPVGDVRRPTVEVTRARQAIEGAEDFWQLLDRLETDVATATVGLLGTSGLRIGEAANLTWDDWDTAREVLNISRQTRRESTKRHERMIPVPDVMRHFLTVLKMQNCEGPYVIGGRQGTTKVSSQVNVVLKPFGLSPKDMRRWFRTSLETLGVQWYQIDDLLGHRASRVRAAYTAQSNLEGHRKVMDRFNEWLLKGKAGA